MNAFAIVFFETWQIFTLAVFERMCYYMDRTNVLRRVIGLGGEEAETKPDERGKRKAEMSENRNAGMPKFRGDGRAAGDFDEKQGRELYNGVPCNGA